MRSYETVSQFDEVAERYDALFTHEPTPQYLRARVQNRIVSRSSPGSRLLDLACGTGEDALFFYLQGFEVTALDASARMLAVARRKHRAENSHVNFLQGDIRELGQMFTPGSFETIVSNFGGVNCIEDVGSLLASCHTLLTPNGVIALCLMNRYSLWEICASLARGNLQQATRRWSDNPVMIHLEQSSVPTWYHTIARVREYLQSSFRITDIVAYNVISPPPFSTSFQKRHPLFTRTLHFIERGVETLPPFSYLGDHTLIIARRLP